MPFVPRHLKLNSLTMITFQLIWMSSGF